MSMIYFITNRIDREYQISSPDITITGVIAGRKIYLDLLKHNELSIDFETSGLETFTLLPILFAIGTKEIQLVIDCTTINLLDVIDEQIEDKLMLGQNIKFDLKILKFHYNIHLNKIYDTMNVDRVIYRGAGKSNDNPDGLSFGLKDIVMRHLKFVPESMQEKEDSRNRFIGQTRSSYIPIDQDILYVSSDIAYLEMIKEKQKFYIDQYNLSWYIDNIANPISLDTADCELRGFNFDTEKWKNIITDNKDKQFELACNLDGLLIKYRDELLKNEDKLLLTGGQFTRERKRHQIPNKIGLFGEEVCDKDYYRKGGKPKFNTGNINWDSSVQVVDICARLKIPLPVDRKEVGCAVPRFLRKKNAKGDVSLKIDNSIYKFTTDKTELGLMINEHKNLPAKDFYKTLSEYRKYSHYISSFGENFLEKINPITKRIHTIFRTESSETGRFQSGGGKLQPEYYNAQNIPRDGEFRHCFIASPGYSITVCDLSGAEVTILCDKAQDEVLYEWAVKNDDAHSPIATACWRNIFLYRAGEHMSYWKTAKEFFQKKDEVYIHRLLSTLETGVINTLYNNYLNFTISKTENKEYRQTFKNVTFAVFYGARDKQIAKTLDVNDEEGAVVIGTMRQAIPKTFEYLDRQITFVMNYGYIPIDDRTNTRTWFKPVINHLKGQELLFHHRKIAEGGARNYPIQGTQAAMIKEAIIEIGKSIKEQKIDAHLLSTVHDELVYEQSLVWDGQSKEWNQSPSKVIFKMDIPILGIDPINDDAKIQSFNKVLVSFPEFVKLTMCQVANRYLKYYTMGAEYHVKPYWTK